MWVDTLPFDLEDKVLFMKYAGIETKLNGEKVLLLKDTDILAIIDNEVLDK
jgi:co-chaperonin GroES (HSP10)